VRKGNETREYVWGVFGRERKMVGHGGGGGLGTALVGTGLVVGQEMAGWLSTFLAGKKKEAKEVVSEKTNN
jgi:hypothetical protein